MPQHLIDIYQSWDLHICSGVPLCLCKTSHSLCTIEGRNPLPELFSTVSAPRSLGTNPNSISYQLHKCVPEAVLQANHLIHNRVLPFITFLGSDCKSGKASWKIQPYSEFESYVNSLCLNTYFLCSGCIFTVLSPTVYKFLTALLSFLEEHLQIKRTLVLCSVSTITVNHFATIFNKTFTL